MKRTAESQAQMPLTQTRRREDPVQADTVKVPPGRQKEGSGLRSLAVYGHGLTLQGELQKCVQRNPGNAEWKEAAKLIAMLDASDELPAAGSNVVQAAAWILLDEHQGKLLCRLAEKKPDHWFHLDVGNSPEKTGVLEAIGADWPAQASATLYLSTALPGASAKGLHAFLRCPVLLNVDIQASWTKDATVLADALRVRELNCLKIHGSPLEPDLLKALSGVLMGQLQLEVRQPPLALLEGFKEALVNIIKNSGTQQLDIAKCKMDGKTTAHLLACRNDWQIAIVRFSAEVSGLLSKGGHKIGWLELDVADDTAKAGAEFMERVASAECMQLLHLGRVSKLVLRGPVNLVAWVESMDLYASSHNIPRMLESFKASFLTKADADAGSALTSLEQSSRIVKVFSQQLSTPPRGYKPLDPAALSRLALMSNRNKMALHQQQAQHPQQVRAQGTDRPVDADTVDVFVDLLSADRPLQHLLEFMRSTSDPWLLPSVAPIEPQVLAYTGLVHKLQVMQRGSMDGPWLKAVVTARLRSHPHESEPMLIALTELGLLVRRREVKEWRVLGRSFQITWVGGHAAQDDGAPYAGAAPPNRVTAAVAGGVKLPAQGAERWALVEPSTHAGFDALVQKLNKNIEAYTADDAAAMRDGEPPGFFLQRRNATALIRDFLAPAAIPVPLHGMATHMCIFMAEELLKMGQGKLLRHILPAAPRWDLQAGGPHPTAALEDLVPWPAGPSKCNLRISVHSKNEELEQVFKFAKSVPPDKLFLGVNLQQPDTPHFWDALVRIVESRPGLTLGVTEPDAATTLADGWISFFHQIKKLPVGTIELYKVMDRDARLLPVLREVALGSGVQVLKVSNCGKPLVGGLLTCQAWETIQISTSPDVADLFRTSTVSAKKLLVYSQAPDHQQCAEDIIGSCKNVDTLELTGWPLNVVSLARGLERGGSVLAVKHSLTAPTMDDTRAALALFRRNARLLDIEPVLPRQNGGPRPARSFFEQQTMMLTRRNLLQDSAWFREGVREGLAVALADTLPTDLGSHIAGFLDQKSARAVSMTNSATYAASQARWRMEIDRLADLFAPGITFDKFAQSLNARITPWKLPGVKSAPPTETRPEKIDLIKEKIRGLREAGLHDSVIGLVLRRRLARVLAEYDTSNASNSSSSSNSSLTSATAVDSDLEGKAIHALLQALTYVGVVTTETWLLENMGVALAVTPNGAPGGV